MTENSGEKASVVVERLRGWNPNAIEEVIQFRGETTVVLPRKILRAAAELCRDHADLKFNLLSDATTPEHLMLILDLGHLNNVGICLDLGHAHINMGIAEAIAMLGNRIVSVHAHDNHGQKDEHLWPGDGTIDWPAAVQALRALANPPAAVLEIGYNLNDPHHAIQSKIEQAFAKFA